MSSHGDGTFEASTVTVGTGLPTASERTAAATRQTATSRANTSAFTRRALGLSVMITEPLWQFGTTPSACLWCVGAGRHFRNGCTAELRKLRASHGAVPARL